MTFEFRLLATDDFPLILEWLSKEYVKEWWDDVDDALEKVGRHYGSEDDVARFMAVLQQLIVGYNEPLFTPNNQARADQ